jgi:electron transfer flavoprotein alpha subunit
VRTPAAGHAETASEAETAIRKVDSPHAYIAVVGGPALRDSWVRGLLGLAHSLPRDQNTAVVAVAGNEHSTLKKGGADRWIQWPRSLSFSSGPDEIVQFLLDVEAQLRPVHWLFPHEPLLADVAFRLAARIGEEPVAAIVRSDAGEVVCPGPDESVEFRGPAPRVITAKEQAGRVVATFVGEAATVSIGRSGSTLPREYDIIQLPVDPAHMEIEEAPLVVSGGAGVKDWGKLQALALQLGAALGATRVVCDAAQVGRERQIGASGRQVGAAYYLAFGISGAIQHLQGIERCVRVAAVNHDPYAPIFKRADLGAVADAGEVISALLDLLANEHARK